MGTLRSWNALVLSVALSTAGSAAFASETPVSAAAPAGAGISQTETTTVRPSIMDNLYLNYFAIFHGAPLNDISSTRTPDRNGAVTSKAYSINLDSEVTAAYLITPELGVGPVIPFIATPVRGEGLTLGDVGVKGFDRKLVNWNGLVVYANLILQAPTSKSSQHRDMTFAVKTTPNIRYSLPGSRFTFGAWTEAKEYAGVTFDKTFKLLAAPYVNYRLAKNFSLNLEYEMEWHHDVGTKAMDLAIYQTDLQPGFVWNITPKVMINPYLQLFTTNRMTFDNTAVGAVISATAF